MEIFSDELSYKVTKKGCEIYLGNLLWASQSGDELGEEKWRQIAVQMCKSMKEASISMKSIIEKRKEEMIQKSKESLHAFLNSKVLISDCHGGFDAEYSVGLEKQNRLHTLIRDAEYAGEKNVEFISYWNARGLPGEKWTLGELKKLSIQIYNFLQPYIRIQQNYENNVINCSTLDELDELKFEL